MTVQPSAFGALVAGTLIVALVLGAIIGALLVRGAPVRVRRKRRRFGGDHALQVIRQQTEAVVAEAKKDPQLADKLAKDPAGTLDAWGATRRGMRASIRLRRRLKLGDHVSNEEVIRALTGDREPEASPRK